MQTHPAMVRHGLAKPTKVLVLTFKSCTAQHLPALLSVSQPLYHGSASAVPQHILFSDPWTFVHAISTASKPLNLISASSNPVSATYQVTLSK